MSHVNGNTPIREQMERLIKSKQQEICSGLEALEPTARFQADSWSRGEELGGGTSCVIQNGETFEKGGVNISVVYGKLPPKAVERMRADHKNLQSLQDGQVPFYACGLSMVIHPKNPHAPTVHLNYRYFETWNPDGSPQTWWFGGGADMTPFYLYEEDARLFHQTHKDALDKHDKTLYPKYKKWCDEYFYIKHRQETRGIGGIFFDDFDDRNPEDILSIVSDCFDAFLPAFVPIVERRKDLKYTEDEKQWQGLRRGRYVEFNLVYDRGTHFGLQTPGSRVESILMSLPTTANWFYDYHPEPGTREAKLLEILRSPVEWT